MNEPCPNCGVIVHFNDEHVKADGSYSCLVK